MQIDVLPQKHDTHVKNKVYEVEKSAFLII